MRGKNRYFGIYILIFFFILVYFFYKLFFAVYHSLFFYRPERTNILLYGATTRYYSLHKNDKQNYTIVFNPDLKLEVPGGYGQYRIGSLGKLVKLEKNPDLLRKTFAVNTTSFVHFYFYKESDEIYYGDDNLSKSAKPSFKDILFLKSNAPFFSRIHIALSLLNNSDKDFKLINYKKTKNEKLNDLVFEEDSFIKESIGLLYNSKYRDEARSVQIVYADQYQTASSISALLEGNGIRVSDLTRDKSKRYCLLIVSDAKIPQTAKDIAVYFDCPIAKGKTDVYDIIFQLGEREGEWKI